MRILAQYICDKHRDDFPDLSAMLVIFPSQRNKLYFRRYMLEVSQAHGFIPPTMKTINELMEVIYESIDGKKALMLDTIERSFVLKKVVNSLKVEFWKDLPFLRFISVGTRLLSFFDELSRERVAFETIEEHILSGHYPEKYVNNELTIFKRIYETYKKNCAELGYHDEIDKCEAIYKEFHTEILEKHTHIVIAGIAATTALENRLIREILANLPAEFIIHSSQRDLMKAIHTDNPFYVHAKLLNAINAESVESIKIIGDRLFEPPVFHIKRTETISQQTFFLKDVLKKIETRYEPHRIAIILVDETTLYAVIETLKASGLEYNISAGLPFTQSILYSFLMELKDVIDNNGHYKKFFSFIKHPLFKNAVVEKKSLRPLIYRLEDDMIEKQLNYFEFENHTDNESALLVTLIRNCIDTVQSQLPLNQYVDRLINMLNNLLSYNEEFIKKNSPDVMEFLEHLAILAKLRIPAEQLETGAKMLEFILSVLKDETFTHTGDPMKGVQVIGLLEARNLDFDCVIITSMNEGIFPRRSEKDLFINQAVRKEIGLPYDKERENLYYYYFQELISGKKEVYISYIEEEKRDIRSRFIDFLIDTGVVVDQAKIPLNSTAIEIAQRWVKKDHDLIRGLRKLLSSKGLSPTHLKDYRECPYRFYLKYLLGIQEPKEIIEEAGPAEWGTAIHNALKYFYKFDFPSGIIEKEFENAKSQLYKRLYSSLKNELAHIPKQVSFLDLEMYKKRMEKFLRSDLERFGQGFRIVTDKIEKQIMQDITVNDMEVKLFGYPDRIDINDGKYYIIDYKSKAPPRKKYHIGDEFTEFQLPLYGLIMSEGQFSNIGGLAYYEISKDTTFISIAQADDVVVYLNDFKKMLLATIREILDKEVSFHQTVNQDNCRYCAYTHLCGVKGV